MLRTLPYLLDCPATVSHSLFGSNLREAPLKRTTRMSSFQGSLQLFSRDNISRNKVEKHTIQTTPKTVERIFLFWPQKGVQL